jgi:hypothetical protein
LPITPFFVHFAKLGSSVVGIVSELPTNRPESLIWTVGKNKVDLQLPSSENNADKSDFPFGRSARKARMRGLVVLSLFAISASGQPFNPVAKERAPESILQLPEGVRRDLVIRQCVVPKYLGYVGTEDQAYTKGHFRSGTSVDYAVVCHIPTGKVQDVLVYSNSGGTWNGEIIDRGTFDPSPQADKCWATVGVATSKYILDHARAYAPEELKSLPRLDHNGVEVGICDKASTIAYFSKGKWLYLQGAD